MHRFTKIILCFFLLSPLAQKACCWHERWAGHIINKVDKILPLTAAKALVTAYLGAGLVGFSSFEEYSSKAKLAGCSVLALLIGLANVVDKDSSETKQSFVKGTATTFVLATWLMIPELFLGLFDKPEVSQPNENLYITV